MMPPGVVVVPMGQPRFAMFFSYLYRLMQALPAGSVLKMQMGPDITHNLNEGIAHGLKQCPEAGWVWTIGDDHAFGSDIVTRLWNANVPVVTPLVLKRSSPYPPVIYDQDFKPLRPEKGQTGLMRVGIAGGAGMLIRRDVLEVIKRPWFENHGTERQGEDIAFCKKLLQHDIPLHVHLDVHMGHITPFELWPAHDPDKGWGVSFRQTTFERLL